MWKALIRGMRINNVLSIARLWNIWLPHVCAKAAQSTAHSICCIEWLGACSLAWRDDGDGLGGDSCCDGLALLGLAGIEVIDDAILDEAAETRVALSDLWVEAERP